MWAKSSKQRSPALCSYDSSCSAAVGLVVVLAIYLPVEVVSDFPGVDQVGRQAFSAYVCNIYQIIPLENEGYLAKA